MGQPLLCGLDDLQREAVTEPATPLAILAGAGSGKTRVLTRRIAWQAATGRVDPRRVLAVTFTRKAAGELADRLAGLGVGRAVASGTFHGLALGQLRRRARETGGREPVLITRKARLLAPLLPRGRPAGAGRHGELRPPGREVAEEALVAAEIEWAKARLVAPPDYESAAVGAGRTPPRDPALIAGIYARYETEKERRGLIDFDDLLGHLADAIETDAEFAAVCRWRHRHLFVDEFQDVNPLQFRLLRAWLGERGDLCVVGDGAQAVYGFAGADADYLVHFSRHFPGATIIALEANYRSSPQILAAAQAVLPGDPRARPPQQSRLPDGPLPRVSAHPTDEAEAQAVARALIDAHPPGALWSRCAVLYRTNAQSAPLEAALRAAGVPVNVRGGRFLDRPEVAAALAELRRSAGESPGLGLSAHLTSLGRWADADPSGTPAERSLAEHAGVLVRLGRGYLAGDGGGDSVAGFAEYLAATLSEEDAPVADAVDLMTFHRAKGLEWDVVFVTGLERGLVPIAYADGPAALAEERRLLYVALTRAGRVLHLSHVGRRTVGGRASVRQPSPYLAAIEAALAALGPDGGGDWRAAVAARRSELRALGRPMIAAGAEPDGAAEPALLAALVDWRRRLARASGVPAHVIFADATLAAVAAARPPSRAALLTVAGLGALKVERYGDELLRIIDQIPAGSPT